MTMPNRSRVLVWAVLLAVAADAVSVLQSGVRGEGTASRITVGANVHVSAARAKFSHTEVILAADPADPRYLLAGSMITYARSHQSLAYWSSDGGRTWSVTLEKKEDVKRAGAAFGHDPAVAFGPDGSAYFAALPIGPPGIPLFRTSDRGKSWHQAATIGPGVLSDRPFLVLDHSGTKHHGRLYCSCMFVPPFLDETVARSPLPQVGGYAVYSSDDGARTFHDPPAWRIANPPYKTSGSINPVVLSDGTLVAPYCVIDASDPENAGLDRGRPGRGILCVLRSVDGGRSFERGARITAWDIRGEWSAGIPCFAASPKGAPSRDRVFAAWSDIRNGTRKILVAQSNDKGLTWSKAAVLSDDLAASARGLGAYLPAIAVNRDGVVGVSWYDIRDLPAGRTGWDVRFRASSDGGKTWLPSVRVSRESSVFEGRGGLLGDTAGLTADAAGAFHALWVDNRTGIQQVWTARVTVQRNE